jgi:hypothetical protein
MPKPQASELSFRDLMNSLKTVRGERPLWPALIGEMLEEKFQKQRGVDEGYEGAEVAISRIKHTWRAGNNERNLVQQLYHNAVQENVGIVTVGKEDFWLLGYEWPNQGGAAERGQFGPADITNAGGLSAYLVMGLGGNVSEREETEFDLVNNSPSSTRGVRGGNWSNDSPLLSASGRGTFGNPTFEMDIVGFRVAGIHEVPEPTAPQLVVARPYHDMYPGFDGPQKVDTSVILIRRDSTAQLATLSNITSSSQGINGVALDFDQLDLLNDISLEYKMSPQNVFDLSIASWPDAPAPSSAKLLADSGGAGSDRVLIKWTSGSIANRYLCIKVIHAGNTIAELYLGHLRGEMTGASGGKFTVLVGDILAVRSDLTQSKTASGRTDVDKSGTVLVQDILDTRSNLAQELTQISVPALP